jgi:hypothetical protein
MIPSREPAAYAELARLVIAGLVALGWVAVDNDAANTIATAVGALLSIVFTVAVRQVVTPVQPAPPPRPPVPPSSTVD